MGGALCRIIHDMYTRSHIVSESGMMLYLDLLHLFLIVDVHLL